MQIHLIAAWARRIAAVTGVLLVLAFTAVVSAVPAASEAANTSVEAAPIHQSQATGVEARRSSGQGKTVLVVVGTGALIAVITYRAVQSQRKGEDKDKDQQR
ncbi:hypothetical protein [Glycomyces xiaoerkulensis]|uniref:hypothetical protein n=1 Tax=Glycomyces xiaoerkulensis TaxID=2038139 RepID=UPI000C25CE01|nr:hypothetical protein [Glycomyces xiaoerkulensis]